MATSFLFDRPDANSPDGEALGIRNRKSIFGCDVPELGWESQIITDPETGVKTDCVRNPTTPQCQLPDSRYWEEDYWIALDKEPTLPFIIKNNYFKASGYKKDKAMVMSAFGTFPNYTYRLGGWACLLDTPDNWFERSMVYADHNTYEGFAQDRIYIVNRIGPDVGTADKCERMPAVPDLRSTDLFRPGPNEVYLP